MNKVFSIKADKDITLVKVVKVATYTVAAPALSKDADTKGLTITAVADKTSAKVGEEVTVTVTVKGTATGDVKLTAVWRLAAAHQLRYCCQQDSDDCWRRL